MDSLFKLSLGLYLMFSYHMGIADIIQHQGLKLNQIILIGSHDAASYGINSYTRACVGEMNAGDTTEAIAWPGARFYAEALAKTQAVNLYEQLSSGVRYLDLRVCYQENKYYASHGFLSTEYDELTNQLNRYVFEHPEAIIILDFDNHIYSDIDGGHMSEQTLVAFAKYFISKINNNVILPREQENWVISELASQKKNFIIFTSNTTLLNLKPQVFWDRNKLMVSHWGDKNKTDELLNFLSDDITNQWTYNMLMNDVRVLQGIITPHSDDIFSYILYGRSVIDEANTTNAAIYYHLTNKPPIGWDEMQLDKLNIIMLDDVTNDGGKKIYTWSQERVVRQ